MASGSPLSLTSALAVIFVRPAGATMRVHQLPKLSRYAAIGTGGSQDEVVAADEIRRAREVHVERQDHRGRLRAVVNHFKADANLHRALRWALRAVARGRGQWRAFVRRPARGIRGVLLILRPPNAAFRSAHGAARETRRAGGDDALVDLELDPDVAGGPEARAQVRRQPVALPGIRIVPPHAQRRRTDGERVLPARAQRATRGGGAGRRAGRRRRCARRRRGPA